MKDFGEYLRQERISRGITLEAIEKRTRIRTHYLVAMEQGRFEQLPEPTYIKAFLKHYANSIGLDAKEVVERYNALGQPIAANADRESSLTSRSERRAKQFRARRRRRQWQWIGVIVIVLLVVGGQFWGNPLRQTDKISVVAQPVPQAFEESALIQSAPIDHDGGVSTEVSRNHQELASRALEPAVSTEVPPQFADAVYAFRQAALAAGNGPIAVPLSEKAEQIRLTLHPTDRSWVELWVDGVRMVYRNVSADEELSFTAESEISLRLGRGESVGISVNGVELGSVGSGIVDKTFVKSSFDEL